MKKKALVCVLLVLCMLVQLTGCGSKKQSGPSGNVDENGVTTDEITLTFWHYEDETTINLLAEEFMKLYPNITVETRVIEEIGRASCRERV